VIVKLLPEIDPGPEETLKVTPSPELADADKAMSPTPYITGDGAGKEIVWDACEIVKVVDALAPL
jgi:hypothetical protein